MSTRFLKPLSTLVVLAPTVAAVPIPISAPTAIALVVYLSVVPGSLVLLLIVKYFYVKSRKADVGGGYMRSSNPSSQPRRRHHLGRLDRSSDWGLTRTAFLVGLLGSPDWEIKMNELEQTVTNDTNSQFSYAASFCSKSDPSGHISLGFFPLYITRPLVQPVSAENSACSIGWVELLRHWGYRFRLSPLLYFLQTNRSSMPWTPPPLPLRAP